MNYTRKLHLSFRKIVLALFIILTLLIMSCGDSTNLADVNAVTDPVDSSNGNGASNRAPERDEIGDKYYEEYTDFLSAVPDNESGVTNRAPVLDKIGDKTVPPGGTLTFKISASDPDGDNLTYSYNGDSLTYGYTGQTDTKTATVRLNMKSYGNHNASYDARIEAIRPEFVIDNPVNGPYGKLYGADSWLLQPETIARWDSLGIKVIGYLTGGYEGDGTEGGEPKSFVDLEFNKQCIIDMAADGVAGVFIDECSQYPENNARRRNYLLELTSLAHSLGLITWGNTGLDQFSTWFFTDGGFDYMQSSEAWRGQSLSPVQQQYGDRIGVTGFRSAYSAQDAFDLTIDAWEKGIAYCYINNVEYVSMAPWFEEYADMLREYQAGNTDNTGLPSGLPTQPSFDSAQRLFRWANVPEGVYTVTFTVSEDNEFCPHCGAPIESNDGKLSDSETITITAIQGGSEKSTATNRAPVIEPVSDKTRSAGTRLRFVIKAEDPDNDTLTYSATGLPNGATFNSNNQVFLWPEVEEGEYVINFLVSDGQLSDTEIVKVNIECATST